MWKYVLYITYLIGVRDLLKVWKKEFSPCEGELAALRRGEEWDPVIAILNTNNCSEMLEYKL